MLHGFGFTLVLSPVRSHKHNGLLGLADSNRPIEIVVPRGINAIEIRPAPDVTRTGSLVSKVHEKDPTPFELFEARECQPGS